LSWVHLAKNKLCVDYDTFVVNIGAVTNFSVYVLVMLRVPRAMVLPPPEQEDIDAPLKYKVSPNGGSYIFARAWIMSYDALDVWRKHVLYSP